MLSLNLLLLAGLLHRAAAEIFASKITVISGSHRVFPGESVHLKCSVENDPASYPDFQWFKGVDITFQTQEVTISVSGMYMCQGFRKSERGSVYANTSQVFEIEVDDSPAILEPPVQQMLVGEDLVMNCRLRGNVVPRSVQLYRDQTVLHKQAGPSTALRVKQFASKGQSSFWCEADLEGRSLKSRPTMITVLETLTEPVMEVHFDASSSPDKMWLICQVEYNAHKPAPPLVYYFYFGESVMRPATSSDRIYVQAIKGEYKCRAKAPMLLKERWSEPTTFSK